MRRIAGSAVSLEGSASDDPFGDAVQLRALDFGFTIAFPPSRLPAFPPSLLPAFPPSGVC